jgi:SAM-dependent methyltransferase
VQRDFDRIALLPDGWDHNAALHEFLLAQLPERCEAALEIGCGTGAFSRRLAERAQRVLALDLAPNMIGIARERSAAFPQIEYRVADALAEPLPPGHFDCVASIAALHHLPIEPMLARLRDALHAGGTLAVADLVADAGLGDRLVSAAALPVQLALRLAKTGRLRDPPEVRRAWREHVRRDVYLTLPQVRSACSAELPGARVRRHLLWRYSIVWRKPC